MSLNNTIQAEQTFINQKIELITKPKKIQSPFLRGYDKLKDNSIYTFFTRDSFSTFINDREIGELVNKLWADGYIIFKLGKAGDTYEEAFARVKSEFSAAMLARPQFNLFFQFKYLVPEKIDDVVRSLLLKHKSDKYLNALLSDKGGALAKLKGTNTGEFILVNVKDIFKTLGLENLLTQHLTNTQIEELLLNEVFSSAIANEVKRDIDDVLFKEFNIKNNIVFQPRKKTNSYYKFC